MTSWLVFLLLVGALCVEGLRKNYRRQNERFSSGPYDGLPNDVREEFVRLELLFTTEDFARKYGYPVETHTVTTEDGYLLTVHRIPGSPRAASSGVKTPVLVQHGLGATSDCWVLMGPERSLGFLLADAGYDVWLGNARGSHYSRKHATMSPLDLAYNNFTWHEMGVYDLPAVIDHILETTNQKQLFYIGHSMGGAMFYVMTSMRPEYNEKIRLAVTMAPAVFVWKPQTVVLVLSPIVRALAMASDETRLTPITFQSGLPYATLIHALCADGKPLQSVCIAVYFAIFGFNYKDLNTTMMPSIVTHGVSLFSLPLLNHFTQTLETGRFQMYDRSSRHLYRQPDYDLSKVTAPVSIMYGMNDIAVPPGGVIHLSKRLPNMTKLFCVPDNKATHNVFIYSINIKELVLNELLTQMKKF